MTSTNPTFRKVHRFVAGLFLLSIPVAAYASFTAPKNAQGVAEPSWLVYTPFLPLAFLTITGIWLLIKPWIATWRARRAA